jgi:tetratricopeptide (TPR) repeat protein
MDELYAGDFLMDAVPRGPNAADWIESRRVSFRDRFVRLAIEGARRVGGPLAIRILTRASEMAPYDDAVARQLMIASSASGPGAVHAEYRRFSDRLAHDLDVEPEPETTHLLDELAPAALPPRSGATTELPNGISPVFAHVPKVLILPPTSSLDAPSGVDHLVDMMMDEVTFSLSRERTFAVFAPHTARQLVRTPFPNGNAYGAGYLVTTQVRANETTELAVTLLNVATHEVLLSETLRVSSDDLGDRQIKIAGAVASKLASGIERAERLHAHTTGTASAYVHFLLGSDAIKVLELRSLRRAKQHLRHAIQLSPEFVPARAMLARALCLEWILLDRKEMSPIKTALDLAREAVSIDPTHPLGHREVGHAMLYLDALDEGVEALRSATGLGPHHADILMNYADGLVHLGEMRDARRIMDQALELNPLPPDQYHWISGTAHYMLGDYAAASQSFRRMKEPEGASRFIAAVEAMNGNLIEAHRQRDIFLRNHPGFRLADYMVPQRKAEDRAHYLEGLRRAGFT